MDLGRLSEAELFGRFFLKSHGNSQFGTYFDSIFALRPLLEGTDWNTAITGYCINVAGSFDTVRLSYFTPRPEDVTSCINSFCAQSSVTQSQSQEAPHATRISEAYRNEELRFRRFLYVYTLIGLDIIMVDLLNARRLMASFRLQVMRSRQPYQPHFQRTFEEQSPTYNSLSEEQKEQFWRDLSNWPNPPQVDWAHMMVNMILP